MSRTTKSDADRAAIKAGEQMGWAAGDFSRFATTIVIVSERLCEAVDLRAGQRVLDVATGSGNTAIAAARRVCAVTGFAMAAARYALPPRGVKPPVIWGTEERVRDLFGTALAALILRRREVMLRYRSVEHWLDFFTTYFGPIREIHEQLDEQRRRAFGEDLKRIVAGANRANDGTVVAPLEYAEVVITLADGDPP